MIEKAGWIGLLLVAAAVQQFDEVGEFPLTRREAWSLLIIFGVAVFVSVSNELSKLHDGEPFRPARFFGNVGVCTAAGVGAPLLIAALIKALFSVQVNLSANIGLSITCAYIGREMLNWVFSLMKALTVLAARLKGMKISFDGKEDEDADPAAPPVNPPAAHLPNEGGDDRADPPPDPT